METTERGIIIIDVFGDSDDYGFGIIVSESPKETEKIPGKTISLFPPPPMPELQIVPISPSKTTPKLPSPLKKISPGNQKENN